MRSAAKAKRDRDSARAAYWRDPDVSRAKSRQKVAVVRAERILAINALKLERGCLDCGYRENPVALQFDHRDPKTKEFGIAKALTCSWRRLLAEIAKCDVRCANCHAVRSVREGHLGRPRLALVAGGEAPTPEPMLWPEPVAYDGRGPRP